MKKLTKYLSTKPNKVNYGFPRIPKLDTVIKFLNENEFVQIPYNKNSFYITLFDTNSTDKKRYMYAISSGRTFYWLRFCKEGECSSENPIYFCRLTENGIPSSEKDDLGYIELIGRVGHDIKFNSYEEFCDEVDKNFEWIK